jgi:DNA-binding NarL/FixJ family response regulator
MMPKTPAKLVIVDDHRLFADGFAALNAADGDRYEITAYDAPEAFLTAMSEGLAPNLVILDLVMKQMNGLTVLAALRNGGARFPVLMLSGISDDPPINEMRALGANGFLHKSADQEALISAIDSLLEGGSLFEPPDGEDDVYDAGFQPPTLAARQIEVLALISEGASNRIIAETLEISENTVKSHLRALYAALGAKSRTGAVRKAQMLGLI